MRPLAISILMLATIPLAAQSYIPETQDIGDADFRLSMRITNHNNAPNRRYPTQNGKKVSHPGFSFKFDSPDSLAINIKTIEGEERPVVRVTILSQGDELANGDFYKGLNPYTNLNIWNLSRTGEEWQLKVGDETLSWTLAQQPIAGIEIAPQDGADVELFASRLETKTDRGTDLMTEWTSEQLLDKRYASSRRGLEGYWTILDRELDEDLLRMGGKYRLAAIATADGYDFIYLSGAKTCASSWKPGMLKMRLSHGAMPGLFNVEWFDAEMLPMSHDIEAQIDEAGKLVISFPYQKSQIRLTPTE